jgi:hypothetical protein
MATIAVTAFPARSYNRIDTSFAGEPVRFAKLTRVMEDTGEETAVRPHTGYDGDCMATSGDGLQRWWDTTVPFDRPYHYRADACTPNQILDTFTRTVAGSWDGPDWGANYVNSGGAAGDYSVGAGVGKHSLGTVNVRRLSYQFLGDTDAELLVLMAPTVVPTGADMAMGGVVRLVDSSNYYNASVDFRTTSKVRVRIRRQVAGTFTDLTTSTDQWNFVAGTKVWLRFRVVGSALYAKIWIDGYPEPGNWTTQTVDTALTVGTGVGVRSILNTGNTNGLPVVVQYDNLTVIGLDSGVIDAASTAASASQTTPSGQSFWLKNPVAPCQDRRLEMCVDGNPNCLPGNGLQLLSLDDVTRASLTTLTQPQNRDRPRATVRARQQPSSRLLLLARSFADRADVLALLATGQPLFLQGPGNYGIPDWHIAVGEVTEGRGLPDLRFQPRILSLPFNVAAPLAGPMLGPCSTQISDQCYTYATWDAMEAAGIIYRNLFDGSSTGGPGVA